jgi:two-component system, NtrC family, response regulator AtoC
MAIEKVIVVDDDATIRRSLELQPRGKRLSVALCASISEAERTVAREPFDLMFVDVRLPDGDGTDLLARLSSQPRRPVIVMMTGHGSVESAVSCIRAGAFDYIIKPFSSGQIDVVINKAASFIQALKVNQVLSFQATDPTPLIGESQGIRK